VGLLALFSAFFMEEVKVASELDGVKREIDELKQKIAKVEARVEQLQREKSAKSLKEDEQWELEQLRGIYGDLLALAKELQKKENRLVARQDKLLDEEAFRC
jgi:predicted  nucleic acid-binding Zn-ribbon protein